MRQDKRGRPGRARILALVLAGSLAACAPIYRNHGYVPPQDLLDTLVVGEDTRDSVLQKIGAPTAAGVLNAQGFYYVGSRFRTIGPLAPEEIERTVLAVTFTANGTLQDVATYGLEDGRVVALSRRVTDDNLPDITFLGQLLGNVGRIDASTLLDDGSDSGI